MHANLCMRILTSIFQDGGNPFPVTRLLVLNSTTDLSQHTLLLPASLSQWSCQVYIIHQFITGFLVVQEPTCTHAHDYRLLGASCFFCCCCCCFLLLLIAVFPAGVHWALLEEGSFLCTYFRISSPVLLKLLRQPHPLRVYL